MDEMDLLPPLFQALLPVSGNVLRELPISVCSLKGLFNMKALHSAWTVAYTRNGVKNSFEWPYADQPLPGEIADLMRYEESDAPYSLPDQPFSAESDEAAWKFFELNGIANIDLKKLPDMEPYGAD